MMGVLEIGFGDDFEKVLFYFERRYTTTETESASKAKDVGIDRDGGMAVERVEHHVGGFAADAGEFFEVFTRGGDLALVVSDKDLTEGDDIFGFGAKQPDGADGLAEVVFAPIEHILWGFDFGEEGLGGFVDGDVGGLGGHGDGDEELVGVGVGEFGGGVGVKLLPSLENGLDVWRCCFGRKFDRHFRAASLARH